MKIDAVGVTTSNMKRAVEFYSLLGFDFTGVDTTDDHVEPKTPDGSARLMIDTKELITDIIVTTPQAGNHSGFAINYDSAADVDKVTGQLESKGFTIIKQPWDAFWGQRYAIVEDPDGHKIDLYANLQIS